MSQFTPGALFRIPVEDDHAYALMLSKSGYVAFYGKDVEFDDEGAPAEPPLFTVLVTDPTYSGRKWGKPIRMVSADELPRIPKFFRQTATGANLRIVDPEAGRVASARREDLEGLEQEGAWTADHIKSRILDAYARSAKPLRRITYAQAVKRVPWEDEIEFDAGAQHTFAFGSVARNGQMVCCPVSDAFRTVCLRVQMTLDPANDRAPELGDGPAALPAGDAAAPDPPSARLRRAIGDDRSFLVEMAQLASVIEDRPLPEPTAPEVAAMLPGADDVAVIAVDAASRPIGAAWWSFQEPPLLTDRAGNPVPEMIIAVTEAWRGRGVGGSLIEALAGEAAYRFGAISLNVHIRNPAARLYSRTGFEVAGKGRGPLGVAMLRALEGSGPPR